VMEIVHDPDVGESLGAQSLDDGDLVLGFTEPAPWLYRATVQPIRPPLGDRLQTLCLGLDPRLLSLGPVTDSLPPVTQSCALSRCLLRTSE